MYIIPLVTSHIKHQQFLSYFREQLCVKSVETNIDYIWLESDCAYFYTDCAYNIVYRL